LRPEFAALSGRTFRRLLGARTVSLLGSSMTPIALAFGVLALAGGSATQLGLVFAARAAAQIGFLLFGGVLGDRVPRARLMMWADLVAGSAQTLVAVLFLSGHASLAALIVLFALDGAASAAFMPSAKAVIPLVLPPVALTSGNALLGLSTNAARVVGAGLAGLIVAGFGPGWAIAADALTFFVSAGLLAGLRVPHVTLAAPAGLLEELRAGWSEIRSREWLWLIILQFALVNACFASVRVLGPVIANERLGGAAGWSAVVAAEAFGLIAGNALALRAHPRFPLRVATLLTLGFTPPFVALALGAPLWIVAAAMLGNGLCGDLFGVLWDTAVQTNVPAKALARVNAYDAFGSFVFGPLGLALAGPLAAHFGAIETLLTGAALVAASAVCVLLSRSVRTLRAAPQAPVALP
jgi:MFS family permease